MTFDEWLESYFSGVQIDDAVTGMMRIAFEAGRYEAGAIDLRDNDKIVRGGLAGALCMWTAIRLGESM